MQPWPWRSVRSRIPGLAMLLLLLLSGVVPRPHRRPEVQLQLDTVKQSILQKLGMDKPPIVQDPLGQDELRRARRLYWETVARLGMNRTTAAEPQQDRLGVAIHYLIPKLKDGREAPFGTPEAPGSQRRRLYTLEILRPAALHQNLEVLRAELVLFNQSLHLPASSRSNTLWPARVNIYRLVKGSKENPTFLSSQLISMASSTLSLRDAVEQWLASAEQSLCLGLEFSAEMATLLAPTVSAEGTELLPLEVETQEQGRVRQARQLDEECGKGDQKCCLRGLKVSFEAIGWSDWVVAPSSYSMKFCEGSCPHNYKPASMHAQIKGRLHSLSGETPAPCCVPSAYEPMVLMHYGSEGRLVTQVFDDMIVTGCHCA